MRRTIALALVLLGAGGVGCSHPAERAAGESALTIAQQREPMSLNPALENGASATEWGLLLFQYLVKFDDSGKLVGDAASAVPTLANGGISPDGLTIVYHLRPHLRFSDGTPLTASDCVWSIRAVQNPANNTQSRYGYDRVARADAPSPSTLVLHLRQPFAPLLTIVLAPQGYPILPRHVLASYPNFNHLPFGERPIGSGPYVVDRWDRGDRVVMHANPYYWQGRPAIEKLTIRFVADANTATNMLRTREIGGFFNDEDLGNFAVLRAIAGTYVSDERINAVGAIVFNTQDPITSDPRVRHALAEAIDIDAVVAKTYHGAVDTTNAGRGLFIWAYDPHAFPDVPFDPRHAADLLEQAGWHAGEDGLRTKDGKPLEVLFIIQAQTPADQAVGNQVAAYERRLGVRVDLKQYNVNQFVAPASLGGPVYGGKFQLALYPFVNGDDPDTTDQFSCARIPPNGYNKSRICDATVDALLERGRRTNGQAARIALYGALQRRLYALLPVALLYQTRQISVFTSDLHGQTTSLAGAFWNVGRWTLSH